VELGGTRQGLLGGHVGHRVIRFATGESTQRSQVDADRPTAALRRYIVVIHYLPPVVTSQMKHSAVNQVIVSTNGPAAHATATPRSPLYGHCFPAHRRGESCTR
jgi:hypothetical protein